MKYSTTWRKFKLLMWKNILMRKRNKFSFYLELLFPPAVLILFALAAEDFSIFCKPTIVEAKRPPKINLKELNSNFNLSTKLCYYPTFGFTREMIKKVQSKLKLDSKNVLGFKTESDFLDYFDNAHGKYSIFAVAFQIIQDSEVPKDFVYLIRPYFKDVKWKTNILMEANDITEYKLYLGSRNYIETGFLSLQIALETSFVETVTKKPLPFDIVVQEFPYPQYMIDPRITIIFDQIFPMLILILFIPTISSALSKPTYEKGTGIKEIMKATGFSSFLIFVGWYFHYITVNVISVFLCVVILKLPIWNTKEPLIEYSSFSILFIFLFLFCCSAITFNLLIASRFENDITAQAVGLGIWSISMFLGTNVIKTKNIGLFASIFPCFAVRYICHQIGIYEFRNMKKTQYLFHKYFNISSFEIEANDWSNIHESANGDANAITVLNGFLMLLASCILFSALALYIEQLYPGRYGVAKPCYFIIFNQAFWRKMVKTSKTHLVLEDDFVKVEPPNSTLNPVITIKHLCKRYRKFRALDDLTMDIYEGLITVLLGQDKAGKTTTLSILTGMIKATSGKASIYTQDIRYHSNAIRRFLRYCPQNNVNFEDLNVLDHLVFFGMLKGYKEHQAASQAEDILKELNLNDQREKRANELSGGMQKKLSLGIALMGNPKVLILDEPTSGLDPEARRELWNILLKLKKNRTVVIATNIAEEAEALGDRIAVFYHGRLSCYGTPMFLKNLYGSGYHLTLFRDKKLFDEKNPGVIQADTITNLVRGKLNEATLVNSNVNCLTYLLPYDKKSEYSAVLSEIEKNQNLLYITHITMSVTTLEDVLLKTGSLAGKGSKELTYSLKSSALEDSEKFRTFNLQLSALFQKRWLIFKKRFTTFIIPVLLAVVLCGGAIHLTHSANIRKRTVTQVKRNFKLNSYGKTTVYYSTNNKTGYFRKMIKNYDWLVENQISDAYETDDVHQEILNEGQQNFDFYQARMIVAAEFIDSKPKKFVNAMFSNSAFRGSLISVNLLMNSILKTLKGLKDQDHVIESGMSPLPAGELHLKMVHDSILEFFDILVYWMVIFPIGLLFLVILFMVLPHIENSSQFKKLQLMCGVHPFHYWCIFYITDFMLYFIWMVIIFVIMTFYQRFGLVVFNKASYCSTLMVILASYSMPVIPFAYLFSNAKNLFNGILGYFIFGYTVPAILFVLVQKELLPSWLNYLLVLHPQYGLLYLLLKFCTNAIERYVWNEHSMEEKFEHCKYFPNPCCDSESSNECHEHFNFILGKLNDPIKCMLIMMGSTFLYFAILLILEEQALLKYIETIRLKFCTQDDSSPEEDYTNREDVKLQQERIYEVMNRELNEEQENMEGELLVHNLEKSFNGVKVVQHVSFSVGTGECFGLYGISGSGKTTTFQMLTGNWPLMNGECRIASPLERKCYLSKTPKKYLRNIGYCPQYDSIENVLTGREMLRLFGRLRGISKDLNKEVTILAKCLGFDQNVNEACGGYSDENKRKLNIAMALIGVPPIIFLDEPTTGINPTARRTIWNTLILLQNQKFKPAIVLATRSLEECTVLCNKVAIIKAGEFCCYGTIPQLKTKYAQGFMVTFKLVEGINTKQQKQQIQNLKSKFEELYFGTFKLNEEDISVIRYYINDLNKTWSDVFKNIEELQKKFSIIQDYNITESSLEEVFFKITQSE